MRNYSDGGRSLENLTDKTCTHSFAAVRLCADVAYDAQITTQQLAAWNPWVGPDCDAGVYAGLAAGATRPVCIGVQGSAPSSTTTSSSPPTSTSSAPGPGAPTQTGIAPGCSSFYVAGAGEGCWGIANDHGITLEQFYAWNPAGKCYSYCVGMYRKGLLLTLMPKQLVGQCENLWAGYAYCIAV